MEMRFVIARPIISSIENANFVERKWSVAWIAKRLRRAIVNIMIHPIKRYGHEGA